MGGKFKALVWWWDKQAELAPATKAKNKPKTHLSKKENQALVLQGPKAGSADPEAKFKALKWLISIFFTTIRRTYLVWWWDKQAATA